MTFVNSFETSNFSSIIYINNKPDPSLSFNFKKWIQTSKPKRTITEIIFLSPPPKSDVFYLITTGLLKIPSDGPHEVCWNSNCTGTGNLRACKLKRTRNNQKALLFSFLTPTFRINVLLFSSPYRRQENLNTLSPDGILRPGVQQLQLLLCDEHLLPLNYSDFYFTSLLCKFHIYD